MHHTGWESAIRWGAWFIVMVLVMGLVMAWLGRGRLKPRRPSEAGTLAHPHSTLAIGVVTALFFGALAILSRVYLHSAATWLTTATFACLALLGLPLIADYYHARHRASDAGLEYGGLTGNHGSMRWAEVRSLRYGKTMKWFRIEDAHGNVARISIMLAGLPEFAALALRHVPPEAMDAHTRTLLEQTADGRPPAMFW